MSGNRKSRAKEKLVSFALTEYSDATATIPDVDDDGWDLFVGFPHPDHSGSAEDRPAQKVAYVQVKSTKSPKSNSAQIKLSNVQKSCISHDPWFIVRVYPKKRFRVEHVWGDLLFEWMKELRAKSRSGFPPLNKQTLTLNFNGPDLSEEELGSSIKAQIDAVGPRYHEAKLLALKTYGYEKHAGVGRFIFSDMSKTDLAEMFLGVRKKVPVKSASLLKVRFGIEDEAPFASGGGSVTFTPTPIARCWIKFTRADGSQLRMLGGDVLNFRSPSAPLTETHFGFAATPFVITSAPDGEIKFHVRYDEVHPVPIRVLEAYSEIMMEMYRGPVTVSVQSTEMGKIVSSKMSKLVDGGAGEIIAIDALVRIAKAAGNDQAAYKSDDFESCMLDLMAIGAITANKEMWVAFACDDTTQAWGKIAYWFRVKIDDHFYYGMVSRVIVDKEVTGDCVKLTVSAELNMHVWMSEVEIDIGVVFSQFIDDMCDSCVLDIGDAVDVVRRAQAAAFPY